MFFTWHTLLVPFARKYRSTHVSVFCASDLPFRSLYTQRESDKWADCGRTINNSDARGPYSWKVNFVSLQCKPTLFSAGMLPREMLIQCVKRAGWIWHKKLLLVDRHSLICMCTKWRSYLPNKLSLLGAKKNYNMFTVSALRQTLLSGPIWNCYN